MASIAITASIQRACSNTHHVTKKQQPNARSSRSFGTKQSTQILSIDIEGKNGFGIPDEQEKSGLPVEKSKEAKNEEIKQRMDGGNSGPKLFDDERWKNGTWDLNMFVKDGRMDWDGVIVAGRAAMVGFFTAYLVDVLTGLDMVGQTGNFICKAGLFATVTGIIVFRRKEDFGNLKKLADEATFYDKQWQASWQGDRDAGSGTSENSGNNNI